MKNKTVIFLWLWAAVTTAMYPSTPSMKAYTIDLPHYVLHFSIPDEISDSMPSWKLVQRFDPSDINDYSNSYSRNGFLEVAAGLHEFKGPFWANSYGRLEFGFSVQQRSHEYKSEIATIDGLSRYIQLWSNKANPSYGFQFDKGALNGTIWVRRWVNTFCTPSVPNMPEQKESEIFSQTLDREMFLEVYFTITESTPGSAKKWKLRAEELRDAIKATIVLEPKK